MNKETQAKAQLIVKLVVMFVLLRPETCLFTPASSYLSRFERTCVAAVRCLLFQDWVALRFTNTEDLRSNK